MVSVLDASDNKGRCTVANEVVGDTVDTVVPDFPEIR